MKKAAVILAVLFCILTAACATAETAPCKAELQIGTDLTFDLTNDGSEQTIRLQLVGVEDEAYVQLVVFGSDGGVNLFDTELGSLNQAYVTDMDGNGENEILLSGSVLASDWQTYCLRYTEERGIEAMPFSNIDRGSDKTGFAMNGYGMLQLNDDGTFTLTGYQDVLGTYMGSRTFELRNGKLKTCDDGLWRFEVSADNWDMVSLMPVKALKATMENGVIDEVNVGEALAVEASDLKSVVYFRLQDGRRGSFAIKPNIEQGWGSLIDGENEEEYFPYLPYAG